MKQDFNGMHYTAVIGVLPYPEERFCTEFDEETEGEGSLGFAEAVKEAGRMICAFVRKAARALGYGFANVPGGCQVRFG